MRTAVRPDVKKDPKTLSAAWASIKQSGESRLKVKKPDLLWPAVDNSQTQSGKSCNTLQGGAIIYYQLISMEKSFNFTPEM